MADLKRKQLRQFLSGSFNITGSLNVTGSVEFDKNISGSITSTGSFSRLQGDTISVTHSPYASGSGVQALMDATGSYASASTKYVKESQTGSFGSGSDVQNILNTYVQQSESSSFASGSDLQTILAESSSYVVESETGSFLQFSDTASFSTLHVEGNITTSGSITAQRFNTEIVSSSVIFASGSTRFGDTIDDTHNITGSLFVSGNVTFDTNLTGSLTSTGSFGNIQIGNFGGLPFASGSDLHQILAESSSYLLNSDTSSLGATSISSTLSVVGDISTSGSVIAREFKTEFVSSSIIFASGSQIFGNSEDDTHAFSGSVNIGDMVLSGSRVGVSSDLDLLTLSTNNLTINGGIVVDDGANIGVDSDTNLLTLNDQSLVINGTLDSTGRIDAQSGLQVSGSSLQVGNDLTLNYTSPVSHSLMFVNYTDKTVDLLPAASSSGQLAQFNGTSWVITDEIDGGSF